MHCFSCARELELAVGGRIGFRERCPHCDADVHVCRNCAHYDPGAYNDCREPGSERVADRERANRCEWFAPAGRATGDASAKRDGHRAALDALFKKS